MLTIKSSNNFILNWFDRTYAYGGELSAIQDI